MLSMGAGLIDDFIRNILALPFCPYHCVHTILSHTILSVYHFVQTILSVPFCPLPFCPVTMKLGPETLNIQAICPLSTEVRWLAPSVCVCVCVCVCVHAPPTGHSLS